MASKQEHFAELVTRHECLRAVQREALRQAEYPIRENIQSGFESSRRLSACSGVSVSGRNVATLSFALIFGFAFSRLNSSIMVKRISRYESAASLNA